MQSHRQTFLLLVLLKVRFGIAQLDPELIFVIEKAKEKWLEKSIVYVQQLNSIFMWVSSASCGSKLHVRSTAGSNQNTQFVYPFRSDIHMFCHALCFCYVG